MFTQIKWIIEKKNRHKKYFFSYYTPMDGTTVCKPILNQKKEKYYGKCKEETTEYYQKK